MRFFPILRHGNRLRRNWSKWWAPALAAAIWLCAAGTAHAQVVAAGDQGGLILSAGGMGTAGTLQYGDRNMIGLTAFVDAETHRSFGLEAEGRWLDWHQTSDVHAETYSIGGRYHFNFGRWEPYIKGLVGFGDFNFPYNLATGRYLVLTEGGGVDMRLNRRFYFRGDVEFQDWPQFTYGSMSSAAVSAGLRVRIF